MENIYGKKEKKYVNSYFWGSIMGMPIESQDRMHVELKYVSKDSIHFRYAYSEDDLMKAEFYTLNRM